MATTGSATPAGPPGRGDGAEGLKTHISTALSGLLDRALVSQAEQSVSHQTPGPAAVQTSALRVTKGPTLEQLFLLWAAECAAAKDVPEPYPYSCPYCSCGFKYKKTRNRHVRQSHKREIRGGASKWEDSDDDPEGSEGSDCKLKPPETGSLASEYPTESDGRPVTTCTGVAGGSSGSGAATTQSVAGAPADSARLPDRLHSGKRPAGEEAAATRVAEEPEASGPPAVQTSTSALARELHRLIRAPAPARLVLQRASERAAGVVGPDPYPFPCLYCDSRFEQQSTCNRHMGRAHRTTVCPDLKLEELEDDPCGVASDEASERKFATVRMPLKKHKTIGQVDSRAKKLKQLRRQEQSRRLGTLHQRPAGAGQQLGSDTPGASTVHVLADTRGVEESGGCDGGAQGQLPLSGGGGTSTSTGFSSFVDSFSQSLEILGSRTVDDDAGVGVTAEAAPSSAYPAGSPEAPYPVADPAGLRELQRAMGATDEEMAILQQLGGEGPVWAPVKIEVSPSTSVCVPKQEEEEEEEEKVDITDLDWQWTTPETPPAEVSCDSGEGAAVTSGTTGGPPAGVGGAAAAAHSDPAVGSLTRQRRTRPTAEDGDGAEDLLAGYEAKEMVCPACHRFFLGFSALQRHVRAAHDGRVDPDPYRRRKSHRSSVGGASEVLAAAAAAAPVPGMPNGMPSGPVCPLCRELVKGKDALAAHVAEEHPGSAATIDSTTLPTLPDLPSDESVGLKTHISAALGGLLDRALGSPGYSARRRSQKQTLLPKPKAHCPTPKSEFRPGSSTSGRRRCIYNSELVRHFWPQLITKAPPTEQEVERASASTSGKLHRYPYTCFYCECRFEKQWVRNRHIFSAHRNEIAISESEQGEPEVDPNGVSGVEDRDCDGGPQEEVGPHPGADPEPPLRTFTPAKRGRPPGRGRGVGRGRGDVRQCPSCEEGVRRKAKEVLCELGEQDGRRGGRRGRPRGRARAAGPIQEKTGSLLSQKREIEVVFVNEGTSFPPDCELPDGYDNARDPLSIEEETGALPDAEFSFCDVQSIKKEDLEGPVAVSEFSGCIKVDPDLDVQAEATDYEVYSNL